MRALVFLLLGLLLPAAASAQDRPPIFTTELGGPRLTVSARVATGPQPKSVAVSPDGRRVVVCNFGRADHDNVWVYDALTLARVGAVHFEGNAVETAFGPDGQTLYVSNFRRNVIEVVDFFTLEVRFEIEVGSHPKTIVVSDDGRTLYVANYFGHSISVVDLTQLREVRQLPTGEHPRGMGLMADGTLFAAAFHGDVIHRFDGAMAPETARWDVCRYPRDILLTPERDSFFLTCSLGHIGFYRADGGGRPYGLASTGVNPRSIASTRDGRWLGVANFTSSDVSLIDTVERTHRRQPVPGASRIVGLAMHPGPEIRLYATSWDTAELFMMQPREVVAGDG